jgi:hypothetical protein
MAPSPGLQRVDAGAFAGLLFSRNSLLQNA